MQIGWQFPHNSGGQSQGFRDGAIDTFSGHRLSGLVREVIQNSLDAHDDNAGGPVTVNFSLKSVPKSDLADLDQLALHIDKCSEIAELHKTDDIREFHDHARDMIRHKKNIPVLAISDYNTYGLTGPIDDQYGAWFALTKGTGITQKLGSGSLGSYGHGSKAPFAMSSIRTVYYLSKTFNDNNDEEVRFQGKSILQSHKHPDDGEITQGVGYYGAKNKLGPLLNGDVPGWATSLRESCSNGRGTTILIPFTRFRDDLFPETKITVVANFYYAIKLNRLKVVVDGETINSDNIDDIFHWCEQALPVEKDEIDVDHTESCFESIRTIISSDHIGSNEIAGFGRVDWFLRLGDDVGHRAVAISRESGMLITRSAPNFQRFPSIKPFDMFVFVNAGDGSSTLKRLENPAHDNFEFDRVVDADDVKIIRRKYKAFVKKVREILKNYATVESDDEVKLSELSQLMFDLGASEERGKNTERGATMYVASGAPPKVSVGNKGSAVAGGKTATTGMAKGKNKGKRGGKRDVGTEDGIGNRKVDIIGGEENVSLSSAKRQVSKMRITPYRGVEGRATITFNAALEGEYRLQLVKAGETETSIVELLLNNQPVSSIRVDLSGSGRKNLTLQFANPNDMNFALEGWLDAV